MPPAKPRALDDSRSETSSTITNLKDKSNSGITNNTGTLKGKRVVSAVPNASQQSLKPLLNGSAPVVDEVDPSLPKTEWTKFPTSLLHSYRTAHRLPTSSSYTHPHAALIYQSSSTGMHAPSVILSRRRLREFKHQRRKANNNYFGQTKNKGTVGGVSKDHDHRAKALQAQNHSEKHTIAQSIEGIDSSTLSKSRSQTQLQIENLNNTSVRQSPTSLATAVRKHFNAQQLNEADVVSRFIYVVRQSAGQIQSVRTEGSDGDGAGWSIGNNGREVRKGDGGEVGFRLRFRP